MNVPVRSARAGVCGRALAALLGIIGSATFLAHAADGGLATVTAVQNTVETRAAGASSWSTATVGQLLGARDRIRTGPASRAAIRYSDQTLHRINEKSEVEILPPAGGQSGVVTVLSGQSYFTTRTPKDFGRVQTRTVTAAIKGTEFAVSAAEDGTTVITMIEGTVVASNEYGSVEVGRGEEVVAEPGKAPQRRVAVRPRDAVAWSLYYPQILGGSDAERLRGMGAGGERLSRAAAALSNGQVDSARTLLDEARASDPRNPVALALTSVVALVNDRRDDARTLADQALAADGSSPSALLARSFVAQADFDLDRARELAEKAAAADPLNPEALARAAELRLAAGDYAGAREAADEAVRRQPANARAQSVLGFANLAAYRSRDAAACFDRAVQADSGFALGHAGRGIAQIRLGNVEGGREELQTAATLDPSESLYRSYLGKAYYEEKRSPEAEKELAAAKDLDPKDPTPWLYDAIQLQEGNRPAEALESLTGAIERNDNRAVYRSRLLLDEDRAVRAADLAKVYADLGFQSLGLVAARRSADEDHANFSSHLFLAGNYRDLPGFASAFLSETLQARVYQPVGVNAARRDAPGGSLGFNEYSALFDRPRARGFVSGSLGTTDTDVSLNALDSSQSWSGDLTGTFYRDRFASAIRAQHYADDGFRVNNDQETTVYSAFLEGAVTERDTLQLNAIWGTRETGDLPLRQIPLLLTPQRFDTDETNLGVAWHRRVSPARDLAVSAIWNRTDQTGTLLNTNLSAESILSGPQLEAQLVQRQGSNLTWVAGVGGFNGNFEASSSVSAAYEGDEKYANAYGYARLRGVGPVEFTAGLALESVDSPVGLLPPRDSNIRLSDVTVSDTQVSSKIGVTATFGTGTTLRAAAFSRLASGIGRLQTLEPTQVSGFNQLYEDVGGTTSQNYGLGIDQKFRSNIFFGASWLHRDRDVPEAVCPTPDRYAGCAFQPGSVLEIKQSNDELASVYLNALLGRRVSGSIDYTLLDREFNTTEVSPLALFQDSIHTERYRPQVRVFLPVGFFATVAGTYYNQEVSQFDDLESSARSVEQARFWLLDASLGWRLPRRLGAVTLVGTNLTDQEFGFYEQALQENVVPTRRVMLRADLQF